MPGELAASAPAKAWRRVELEWRGRTIEALVWSRPVPWYRVNKVNLVLVVVVVVRDPEGHQHDNYYFYFVTTDLDAEAAWVISLYAGRWSIGVTFQEAKQHLGSENPQCWRH